MKITTYFMKLCGATLIVICGLVMFIASLASNLGSVSNAFWGLAVMSAGLIALAYVLETSTCPFKISFSKNEPTPVSADTTTLPTVKVEEADTTTVPAVKVSEAEANAESTSISE